MITYRENMFFNTCGESTVWNNCHFNSTASIEFQISIVGDYFLFSMKPILDVCHWEVIKFKMGSTITYKTVKIISLKILYFWVNISYFSNCRENTHMPLSCLEELEFFMFYLYWNRKLRFWTIAYWNIQEKTTFSERDSLNKFLTLDVKKTVYNDKYNLFD